MSKVLLVISGALVFVVLVQWIGIRGTAEGQGRSSGQARPESPSAGLPEQQSPDVADSRKSTSISGSPRSSEQVPSGKNSSEGSRLDAVGVQKVLAEMAMTTARCRASLEVATDTRIYMLDYRTLIKTDAARDRLLRGDYLLVDRADLDAQRESRDETIIAFPVQGRHALFILTRQQDKDVFAAIDQCASFQQRDWNEAAEKFNAMTDLQRDHAIAAHWQAMESIQKIHDNSRGTMEPQARSAALIERSHELAEYYQQLLPWYLVVPRTGNKVWPRASIGR